LVADELIRVDDAAVIEPEAPLNPAGAVSPAVDVDQIILTHLMAVAPSTDDPLKV